MTTPESKLKSRAMTPEESRRTARRVEAALHKHDSGQTLTEHEWMIVQYARHAGRCHVCGGESAGVGVALRQRVS